MKMELNNDTIREIAISNLASDFGFTKELQEAKGIQLAGNEPYVQKEGFIVFDEDDVECEESRIKDILTQYIEKTFY